MWNPDVEPTFGFARYARLHGLSKARDWLLRLEYEHKRQKMEAHAIELALAKDAERRGPNKICEEMGDAEVSWQMAKYSYWELNRSSVHERGCVGGELMNDSDYMRYFLKTNPECARKNVSGKIMGGWNPRLEAAAAEGKQQREKEVIISA